MRHYGKPDLKAMKARILLWSILGGVVVTALTGLLSNTPPMWVGATLYGYPLAWLSRLILAPEYFPWRIDIVNLIVDIVVWTVAVGIVLLILMRIKR
jgi:hypothetical protein